MRSESIPSPGSDCFLDLRDLNFNLKLINQLISYAINLGNILPPATFQFSASSCSVLKSGDKFLYIIKTSENLFKNIKLRFCKHFDNNYFNVYIQPIKNRYILFIKSIRSSTRSVIIMIFSGSKFRIGYWFSIILEMRYLK